MALAAPRTSSASWWGLFWGGASSVGYTLCNVFLRAVSDCDPILVSCLKAAPTMAFALPMVLYLLWRRQRVLPVDRHLAWEMVGAALLGQLAGNVLFQWALGVVGMAMCVPLCLGALIISSAMMSRRLLNETFSLRDLAAMGVLILSVAVLSSGAADAHAAVAGESAAAPWWLLCAGVAGAAVSGVAYAVLGVVIRRCVSRGTPSITPLCIVSTVGFVSLGGLAYLRLGASVLAASPQDLADMLLAGVFNAAAFVALTQSLRLIPVMYVNGINATQTGLAGLAGVVLFQEAFTLPLTLGVLLTILGLFLMGAPKSPGG